MRMVGVISYLVHDLKPALMMVVVQISYAGVNIFYKLAANDGMSSRVMVAYRFIFATAFMLPLALFLERKSIGKLNVKILFLAFLSGLFGGSLFQNLLAESLLLTSATFASAMLNLIPATTFILAISIGLEKLGIRTTAGKAKLMGTIMGIAGATILTFYKGVEIKIWSTHVNLLNKNQPRGSHMTLLHANSGKRVLGSLSALGSCFSFAMWLIVQAKMSKEYPYEYWSTALTCLMGATQAVVFALCMETDWSQWKLGLNIRLLTVTYSGIIASGLMMTLLFWCVRMRGPVFASVFDPLTLVVVAFLGSLMLDEKLHLGSVVGATMIVCGLYAVLWGKEKEREKITELVPVKISAESDQHSIEIVITSSNDHEAITPKKIKEENDPGETKVLAEDKEEDNQEEEIKEIE